MSNLANRVDRLEEEVERLRKYIVIRDGLWVKEHLDKLDDFIISYDGVGDVDLLLQLDFDNLMMCRARVQEDFLEYCRRAALQLEGLTDWALRKEDDREPASLGRKWKVVQENKERRWKPRSYDKDEYPKSIHRIRSMDALELTYCVFTEGQYHDIDREARDRFNCLVKTLQMRNIASHRDERSDPIRRMRDYERKFYKKRESNYVAICSNIRKLKKTVLKYFDSRIS